MNDPSYILLDEHAALELAIQEGAKSPCSKSKRGVVVWGRQRGPDGMATIPVIHAHNGPPPGFACDGTDACKKACGRLCVHAEVRALLACNLRLPSLRSFAFDHKGYTDLLHVKVIDGVAVPSGPPSCVDCSKAILDYGIERVWLLHERGLRSYSALDFHSDSLLNRELPVIRKDHA